MGVREIFFRPRPASFSHTPTLPYSRTQMWDFPLFPEQASTIAGEVDTLFFALLALSALIGLGVVFFILYFAVKYRRGSDADRSRPITENAWLETTWMVIPLFLSVGMFVWAAAAYFEIKAEPPGEPLEVYAIAKQWMWKFKHPNGAREINTLHVPVGRPVRMLMTSQDVIHSFYVPAFRVKQDVLPGRYTNTWFEATKPGRYHLFCTEYCGTDHAGMGGWVYAMEPADYEKWLARGATRGSNTEPGTGRYERTPGRAADAIVGLNESDTAPETVPPRAASAMAAAGEQLFEALRCVACHRVDSTALYPAHGPVLYNLYGSEAELQNNRTVIADAQYLRESILYPQAKLVAGYPALMPTYQGQISEEELMQLVAYIKSLGPRAIPEQAPPPRPGLRRPAEGTGDAP